MLDLVSSRPDGKNGYNSGHEQSNPGVTSIGGRDSL